MNNERVVEINRLCNTFRKDLITMLHRVQTGHPGGSLSLVEILSTLYFEQANISPENQKDRNRDKIILSKGHAAPILYRILAEKKFFPVEDLVNLRQLGSHLQGHPCSKYTPGIEVSTGPLGVAYPVALGIALTDQRDSVDAYTYAILGDGELNEGTIWETCLNASKYNAYKMITIVDNNGVQLDGTNDEIMPLGKIADKFKAFGYNTLEIDGHNVKEVSDAIIAAKSITDKPTVIIAKTVKGKGISFMEGKNAWHGKPISEDDYEAAMKELS